MKRILIVMFACIPFMLDAQQIYLVTKFDGDVKWRSANSEDDRFYNIESFTTVSSNDLIDIRKSGSVYIADKKSGIEYVSTETGILSVEKRIKKSNDKSKKKFARQNKGLYGALKQNQHKKPDLAYGASKRETNTITYNIYDTVYASLIQCLDKQTETLINGIEVEKVLLDNGRFTFVVKNNTDNVFFFNVAHFSDNMLNICFLYEDFDLIPLYPGQIVDMSSCSLNGNDGKYVFFATEIDMSPKLLSFIFEVKPKISSIGTEELMVKFLN